MQTFILPVYRFYIALFLSITLVIALSQDYRSGSGLRVYHKIYQEADSLFRAAEKNSLSEEKQEELNRAALKSFRDLVMKMEDEKAGDDSLAFHGYVKIGILEHYFENLAAAEKAYRKSIELGSKFSRLPDSFLFRPYLYLGIIFYTGNQFDSALAAYKSAEKITMAYPYPLQETERLYNTLGALYYETGNYRQAKNYLEKSISLLPKDHPSYKELLVNYKINLASILSKLEEYDQANTIYQDILPFNIHRDIILHNTGVINLSLGANQKALNYFRKVNPEGTNRVRLFNDFALSYFNLGNYDSTRYYLIKALEMNTEANRDRKNVPHGQTLKISGDLLLAEKKIPEALFQYQEAIRQFYSDFNDTSIYINPDIYSGIFSYFNLFNTLTAKADAFSKLYGKDKNIQFLETALDVYRSAFRLADYVERSYDSDEARLFLNKIKYLVHSKPIDLALTLYERTGKPSYLDEAYLFDQRNKGSVLALTREESKLKKQPGVPNELILQELSIKSAITRLSLKATRLTDSSQLTEMNAIIRDYEIQLGRIQEKFKTMPGYAAYHPIEKIPSVKELQRELLDAATAILSFHLSEKEILVIYITHKKFNYKKIPISNLFFSDISTFISLLHKIDNDKKIYADSLSKKLHSLLFQAVSRELKHITRLIILPDDELHYIPFEALQDSAGKYMVEFYAIQYQYSTAFLKSKGKPYKSGNTLSFAPFFASGFEDSAHTRYARLSYSGVEIENNTGKTLIDAQATKENFLINSGRFPVIHLATHAVINHEIPLQSYIAFYPGSGNSRDYRLYAGEIYNLSLDSTRLVILSACETGLGQLIRGEGLASLSRAFSYAGCPNIITSLWKADDRTTSYITTRLHHYLKNKYTMDQALRHAKLDLIKSKHTDPRFTTPNYWAHLIFIGEYEPRKAGKWGWWLAGGILLIALFVLVKKINLSH